MIWLLVLLCVVIINLCLSVAVEVQTDIHLLFSPSLHNAVIENLHTLSSPSPSQVNAHQTYLRYDESHLSAVKDSCSRLVAFELGWHNWLREINTTAPVFRPKTNANLKSIILAAKKNNCIVRTQGAAHSQDGLIMQERETNVLIVSLADHTVSQNLWKNQLLADDLKARIGAGKTIYDLMTLIRPQGFLMKTRTAGRFFTVGGIVANMVHGGGNGAGFIYEDVTGMLVMKSDGSILEITSSSDLNAWYSSAGLLGVILAVELKVIADNGITMIPEVTYFTPVVVADISSPTNAELLQLAQFIEEVTTKVYTVVATSTHAEFFYEPYNSTLYSLYTVDSGIPFPNPSDPVGSAQKAAIYTASYAALNAAFQDVSTNGAYFVDVTSPCDIIPDPTICQSRLYSAYAASLYTSAYSAQSFYESSTSANDGFWQVSSSKFHSSIIFAPAMAFAQIFSKYLLIVSAFITNPDSQYFPNQALEFRFVNPDGTGILNPIPAFSAIEEEFLATNGMPLSVFAPAGAPSGYLVIEQLDLNWGVDFSAHYSSLLGALQTAWMNTPFNPLEPVGVTNPLIPVKNVHLGKGWGYGVNPNVTPYTGELVPFTDAGIIATTYSAGKTTAVADFNAVRLTLDPTGVFTGGAMLRWLKPSYPNSDFDPRSLVGQDCNAFPTPYESFQCISGCCDSSASDTCLSSGLSSGSVCSVDCECTSNSCVNANTLKTKPKVKPKGKAVCV